MPNLTSVLNEQIRRLAGREVRRRTKSTRTLTAQHRHDLAALKRQVASMARVVAFLEHQEKRRTSDLPVPTNIEGIRFSSRSVKSQRARLGLSAEKFGKLIGVSGLTVYNWELGKSRPRKQQLAKLAAVRGVGKREAMKKLEMLGGRVERQKLRRKRPRKRGSQRRK